MLQRTSLRRHLSPQPLGHDTSTSLQSSCRCFCRWVEESNTHQVYFTESCHTISFLSLYWCLLDHLYVCWLSSAQYIIQQHYVDSNQSISLILQVGSINLAELDKQLLAKAQPTLRPCCLELLKPTVNRLHFTNSS